MPRNWSRMYAAAFSSSGEPVARPRISGDARYLMMPRYSSLLMLAANSPNVAASRNTLGRAIGNPLLSRMSLVEHGGDLHFAAFLVGLGGRLGSGVLPVLQILQLAVDNLFDILPRIVAH